MAKVVRKAHTRKSYVRKDGVVVKATKVKAVKSPITKCKKGMIVRKAYTRTSKSGKKVRVSAACIKDKGKPGKGKKIIGKIKKGKLIDLGYSSTLPTAEREKALKKAVKAYGPLSTFRKLNAVYVLNKRTNPSTARVFKRDRNWVRKNFDV